MKTPFKIIKISDGFWAIEEDYVRSFLVEGREKSMLVDTGINSGNIRECAESLTGRPVFVVNTHSDRDHVGGNHLFDEIHMHPSEYDRYFSSHHQGNGGLVPVWEGEVLDLGVRKFEVMLIPGHTPGSIALLDRENRELIAGDTLQSSSIYMFGSGRNLPAYEATLNKLSKISGYIDTIYPSHGRLSEPPSIIGDLIESLGMIKAGAVRGVANEELGCMLYDCGKAKFYLEK